MNQQSSSGVRSLSIGCAFLRASFPLTLKLSIYLKKRWKEQPCPQHAESCTAAQSPPNGSGGACVHSASKHSFSPRPARTAEKGKTVFEQSFQRTTTNKIRSRACDTQFTHGNIFIFIVCSGAASGKLDGCCKMARKMKELVPASGMFPRTQTEHSSHWGSVFVFVRDVTRVQTSEKKFFVFRIFGSYLKHVQTCDDVRVQSATQSTASVHTWNMSKPVMTFVFKVLYAMDCFGAYTWNMSKPVMTFVFKVLRNRLLRYIYSKICPNPWWRSCSKCYAIDCFGT